MSRCSMMGKGRALPSDFEGLLWPLRVKVCAQASIP